MALTIQRIPDGEDVWGRLRVRFVDIIMDTSYPTGGYLVNASDVGMKMVYGVDIASQNTTADGYTFSINTNAVEGTTTVPGLPATSFNVKAYSAFATQQGNGVTMAGVALRLKIVGR